MSLENKILHLYFILFWTHFKVVSFFNSLEILLWVSETVCHSSMWHHIVGVVRQVWFSPKYYRLETDCISHNVLHLFSKEIMWRITSSDLVCGIHFDPQIWDENKNQKHLNLKLPYITFPVIPHYCTISTLQKQTITSVQQAKNSFS